MPPPALRRHGIMSVGSDRKTINRINKALNGAIYKNNAENIRRAIEAGADINNIDRYGMTPLGNAVTLGYLDVVKMLAAAGADPFICDEDGSTVLHHAVLQSPEILEFIIGLFSNIDIRSNSGMTPLALAVVWGKTISAEILLKAGADPNFRDNMGHTALMIAAYSGNTCDVEITRLLVKYGADLTLCSDSGEDCAHLASSCGRFRVLKLFLEYGMDINSLDKHGFTGIMRAAQKIDLDTIEKLIEMGADLNVKTKRGEDLSSIIARYHGLRQKKILDVIAGINRLKAEDARNVPDTGYEFDI